MPLYLVSEFTILSKRLYTIDEYINSLFMDETRCKEYLDHEDLWFMYMSILTQEQSYEHEKRKHENT